MTLHRIEAIVDCDGCGHRFSTELDPAYTPNPSNQPWVAVPGSTPGRKPWSLYDIAIDSVRGGAHRGTVGIKGVTSVQGDLCLCPTCTAIVDEHTGDDPSPEDVKAAVEKHR